MDRLKEFGFEVWTDEKGNDVVIKPFLNKVFVDKGVLELNEKYQIWECDGEMRSSSLGAAELEDAAAFILGLARASRMNPISLVGVTRKEFESVMSNLYFASASYINDLVRNGYLREKLIKGESVVFPTEKLLENQRISKRNNI